MDEESLDAALDRMADHNMALTDALSEVKKIRDSDREHYQTIFKSLLFIMGGGVEIKDEIINFIPNNLSVKTKIENGIVKMWLEENVE